MKKNILFVFLTQILVAQVWQSSTTGLNAPYIVALERIGNQTVVASSLGGGVWTSNDSGSTWIQTQSACDVWAIKSDPATPQNVYFGTYCGEIYKSTNSGTTWTKVNTTSLNNINDFAFSGGTIYAATGGSNGQVMRSIDGGVTWINAGLTVIGKAVQSLLITSGGIFYAGTIGDGIYKSTNSGNTWAQVNTGLVVSLTASSLVEDNTGNVFAGLVFGAGEGVYKTTNAGASWSISTGHGVLRLQYNKAKNVIYSGAYGSMRYSVNNGTAWTNMAVTNPVNMVHHSIAVFPSGRVLVGMQGDGIWRTTDNGLNWISLKSLIQATIVSELFVNPDGSVVSGTFGNGVYRSTDLAANWGNVWRNGNSSIEYFARNTQNGYLYSATICDGVGRSTDNGVTWTVSSTGLTNNCMRAVAVNQSTSDVFSGSDGGLVYRSTNHGVNWAPVGATGTSNSVDGMAITSNGTIIITAGGDLFRSTNSGASWATVSDNNSYSVSISLDPSGNILVGGGNIVLKSTDQGASFQGLGTGFSGANVKGFAFSGSSIFVATEGNGVWYKAMLGTVGGEPWVQVVTSGLAGGNTNFHSIALGSDNKLLIGSWGNSISKSIKSVVISVPSLSSPSSNATGISLAPTLSWATASNADSYRVEVSVVRDFSSTIFKKSSIVGTSQALSSLSANQKYYWRVLGQNPLNISQFSNVDSFTTVVLPPAINSNSFSPNPADEATEVNVTVDATSSTTVKLFYGKTGQTDNDSITMTLSGGTYTGQIPASYVTAQGAWYRVRVSNSGGSLFSPSDTGRANIPVKITATKIQSVIALRQTGAGIAVAGNWFSLSLPYDTVITLSSILGQQTIGTSGQTTGPKNWSAFRVTGGSLSSASILDKNQGILLYTTKPLDWTFGLSEARTFSIDAWKATALQTGWNLVSWPFTFRASYSVTSKLDPTVWILRLGRWEAASGGLIPYTAYAVNNTSGSPTTIGAALNYFFSVAAKENHATWSVRLKIRAGEKEDLYSVLGESPVAKDGYDATDSYDPFPIGEQINSYFPSDAGRLAFDYRSASQNKSWDWVVQNNTSERTIRLTWELEGNVPNLTILDMDHNKTIAVNSESTYEFFSSGKTRFKIFSGDPSWISEQIAKLELPKKFGLVGNYPNPFNPQTTIRFDVAFSADIRITIFNTLGQRIKTVAQGFYSTGSYDVVWDGRDQSGKRVASGIYFYRMESDGFTESKRMMLIK